jgi:hypothetical protein
MIYRAAVRGSTQVRPIVNLFQYIRRIDAANMIQYSSGSGDLSRAQSQDDIQ